MRASVLQGNAPLSPLQRPRHWCRATAVAGCRRHCAPQSGPPRRRAAPGVQLSDGRCAAFRNVSSFESSHAFGGWMSGHGVDKLRGQAGRRQPHKAWRQEPHPPDMCELGCRLPHRRLRHRAFSMTIVTHGAHTLTLAVHVSPHLGKPPVQWQQAWVERHRCRRQIKFPVRCQFSHTWMYCLITGSWLSEAPSSSRSAMSRRYFSSAGCSCQATHR